MSVLVFLSFQQILNFSSGGSIERNVEGSRLWLQLAVDSIMLVKEGTELLKKNEKDN